MTPRVLKFGDLPKLPREAKDLIIFGTWSLYEHDAVPGLYVIIASDKAYFLAGDGEYHSQTSKTYANAMYKMTPVVIEAPENYAPPWPVAEVK